MTTARGHDAPGPHWPGAQRAYRGRQGNVGPVSNDELARRLEDMSDMFREDFAEIRQAHAAFVLREVYEARHSALTSRVQNLEQSLKDESDQRRALSRWVWGTVVIPVVLFIAQLVMNAQGGGVG